MIVENGSRSYDVNIEDLVAQAEKYRLYICKEVEVGRQCLMQIALDTKYNDSLACSANVLRLLMDISNYVEQEYAKIKTDAKEMLNYCLLFPEALDKFICEEQGSRRINIITFRGVEDVGDVIPSIRITESNPRLGIDLQTSVWVMGKLLKLLDFAHSNNITAGAVDEENILIEPNKHYVQVFDWSGSKIYDENEVVPTEIQCQEISWAAQVVIKMIGGDPETGVFPPIKKISADGSIIELIGEELEKTKDYTDYLMGLAYANESNAERAHNNFYEIVDLIWEREFHEFTLIPL